MIVFAVLVLLMPRTAKFNYDYKKGTPWPYETLVSEFDFPILKTDEQLQAERDEAGTIVIPYYRYSEEVTSAVVKNAQSIDMGAFNRIRPALVTRLGDIYAKGVISDGKVKLEGIERPEPEHPRYSERTDAGTQRVYFCRSRARLMRALSQSLMEAGADFSDGVRLENGVGRVHIMPSPDSEAVVIDAQAADPAKSPELAEGFLGLVKGLEEKY